MIFSPGRVAWGVQIRHSQSGHVAGAQVPARSPKRSRAPRLLGWSRRLLGGVRADGWLRSQRAAPSLLGAEPTAPRADGAAAPHPPYLHPPTGRGARGSTPRSRGAEPNFRRSRAFWGGAGLRPPPTQKTRGRLRTHAEPARTNFWLSCVTLPDPRACDSLKPLSACLFHCPLARRGDRPGTLGAWMEWRWPVHTPPPARRPEYAPRLRQTEIESGTPRPREL